MCSTPHSSAMKNFLSIDFQIYFGLDCLEVDLLEKNYTCSAYVTYV